MAITIDHGNIAAALGLASAAGTAQRDKQVTQDDLNFLGLMQNAQGEADRNYASQIGLALQGQGQQNELAFHQQQAAQSNREFGLQQQQLAGLNANRAAQQDVRTQSLGIRQDQQDTRQQGQDLRDQQYQDKQDATDALPEDEQNLVRATGRLPYIPNSIGADSDGKALETEYSRVARQAAAAQKALTAASYSSDPKDAVGPRGRQSASVPGAAAGMEQQYQAAAQQYKAASDRQSQLDSALNSRTNDILGGTGTKTPGATTAAAVLSYMRALGGGASKAQPLNGPAQSDTSGTPGQQAGQSGQPSGGLPVVSSAADYAALPSGAKYINATDGKRYTKP